MIEAKERAWLNITRTPEEPHGNTSKLSDYHKGKNFELQKSRDHSRNNEGTPGRNTH